MTTIGFTACYEPSFPATLKQGEGLPDFIKRFYQVSDAPGQDEAWVNSFAPDAEVTIGKQQAQGRDQIVQLRQGMVDAMSARKHKVDKVFPAQFQGDDESVSEFMLYGSVWYKLKDGNEAVADWSGHARIAKNDAGELKFKSYRVYLQN